MIDFTNASYLKLKPAEPSEDITAMLFEGEQIYRSFQGGRDSVHFTSKRILAKNVQGITGRRSTTPRCPTRRSRRGRSRRPVSWTRTCELELWFSGLGKVKLEFAGVVDTHVLGRIIGDHVLT